MSLPSSSSTVASSGACARDTADTSAPLDEACPSEAEWSLDLLRQLDWERFEEVCSDAFSKSGYLVQDTGLGPDYGIDLIMCDGDPLDNDSWVAVQCKAHRKPVRVKMLREFFGAMVAEGYARGVFITTGRFWPDALEFAAEQPGLKLIDGEQFLEGIVGLPGEDQADLLETAIEGDYATPSCPNCGVKMVLRKPKGGKDFNVFWGCPNFGPKNCRVTFAMGEGTRDYSSAIRKRTSLRRNASGVQDES